LFDDERVKVTADGEIIDDPDCQPVFDSPTTASIEENIATTQVIFIAHAKSRLSFLKPTYSLSGDDAAKFKINAQTGEASFITPPDFEKPEDRDHDNAYRITVAASQGKWKQTMGVTISVGDKGLEFTPATNNEWTTTSSAPTVDFNNDGKPDSAGLEVTVNYRYVTSFLIVRLGSDGEQFGDPVTYGEQTLQYLTGFAVGDFNADRNQDLVLIDNRYSVGILLGDGSGQFDENTRIDLDYTDNAIYSVGVGDLDGNGTQDLVFSCFDTDVASIMLGDGKGQFQARREFPGGFFIHACLDQRRRWLWNSGHRHH